MSALPLIGPPGEHVTIPYEGKSLYGVLRKPDAGRCPVLVMAPGLDSTKEELHAYEEPFLARGIATLAIDGPGQGEAESSSDPRRLRARRSRGGRLDRERSDVDAKRVAMWGVSLGGYYAPRAAAFEKRFSACIALSGPFEWAEIWPTRCPS